MIRLAEMNDVQSVYRLICLLEETEFDYDRFKEIYENQQKDGRYKCLLTEKDGIVTGLCNIRIEYHLHHCRRIAEIVELCVLEEERNRRTGTALFEEACRTARSENCEQIELVTNMRRIHAHRFYERLGMKATHYGYTMKL